MKRVISFLLISTMVVTSFCFVPKKVEAKSFYHYIESRFDSIKITWTKAKNAKKYIIYRARIKNENYTLKASKYKKIKTVRGKTHYYDKTVKKNKYYKYYVRVVKKNGNKKLNSYDKYESAQATGYLDKPSCDLERFSTKKITFFISSSYRVGPFSYTDNYKKKIKFDAYRKEQGKKKYKKIKIKKKGNFYVDKSVKAGKRYSYKFAAYVKTNKKKYTSKKSAIKNVAAVNYMPKLNVSSETGAKIFKNPNEAIVILKVSNASKYNGNVKFFYKRKNEIIRGRYTSIEHFDDAQWVGWHKYEYCFTEYRYGQEDWRTIPEEGVKLSKSDPIYLKVKLMYPTYFYNADKDFYYAAHDTNYYKAYFHVFTTIGYEGFENRYPEGIVWYQVNNNQKVTVN